MTWRRLLPVLAICLTAPHVFAQSPTNERLDMLGDPLPPGAVARLGTLRFKHAPGKDFAPNQAIFSPDSKLLATARANLQLRDIATGREIVGPWRDYQSPTAAFSPDGALLAVVDNTFQYRPVPNNRAQQVHFYDPSSGKEVKRSLTIRRSALNSMAFTPDGKTLVLAGYGEVSWWDLATGMEPRWWKPLSDEQRALKNGGTKNKLFMNCRISPDARMLAVQVAWNFSNNPTPEERSFDNEVICYDLLTREMIWRTAGSFNPTYTSYLAYSADGKRIAIALGAQVVEVRDACTGKLIADRLDRAFTGTHTIRDLALSADGKMAALGGSDARVIVWNIDAPEAARKLTARNWPHDVECMRFSPDNKTLLVIAGGDIQRYDLATLQEINPSIGHRSPIDLLTFSKDSKRLYSGSITAYFQPREVAAWDAATWKLVKQTATRTPPWPNLGQVSPDQTVYTGKTGDDRLALYDLRSGKRLTRFQAPREGTETRDGFFSPRGSFYVLDRVDDQRRAVEGLYAVPSGKLLALLPPLPPTAPISGGEMEAFRPIAFSADNRLVALFSGESARLFVFETATGKSLPLRGGGWGELDGTPEGERQRLRALQNVQFFGGNLAFSQDGKLLASWTNLDYVIRIWDLASGREIQRIEPILPMERPFIINSRSTLPFHFAWSPDRRVLAVSDDYLIQLWELASNHIRCAWKAHQGATVRALAYSPDGRFLASGSADTTVLIWDLALVEQIAQAQTGAANAVAACWQTLADSDAAKGFAAIRALTALPAESVPWIKERLQPEAPLKDLEELITQLDDGRFRIRQQVTAKLLAIGNRIEPAIDKALAANPPLETRRRLEELRKRVSSAVLTGKSLQAHRAVEVLERIGNPEARQVLTTLASGAAEAPLTVQARAALSRLTTRN
jgi:WD40 repeat protein